MRRHLQRLRDLGGDLRRQLQLPDPAARLANLLRDVQHERGSVRHDGAFRGERRRRCAGIRIGKRRLRSRHTALRGEAAAAREREDAGDEDRRLRPQLHRLVLHLLGHVRENVRRDVRANVLGDLRADLLSDLRQHLPQHVPEYV